MNKIIQSLAITIAISLTFGYIISLFGPVFWKTFLLIFVAHFIIFGIINYFTGIYLSYKMRVVEVEQLRLLENQSTVATCAGCGKNTVVPILLGNDNRYVCDGCDLENAIVITAETVLPTKPVESLDADQLVEEQVLKKLDVPQENI